MNAHPKGEATADAGAATDRRGAQRATLRLSVRLKLSGHQAIFQGRTTNLSRTGAFLLLKQQPKIGDTLHLQLDLGETKETVKAIATVVRLSQPGELPGVGVCFVGFAHKDRDRIEDAILRELREAIPGLNGPSL